VRVILDTNVLISALLHPDSGSSRLVKHWEDGRFDVLTCEEQIDELRRITRGKKVSAFISAAVAGRLINELRQTALFMDRIPHVDISLDPWDNFLFALVEAGRADFLVSGDKAGVLAIGRYASAQIVTVRDMLARLS
jgi:putative PIN family toxin of toxin-antitoxin system